MYVCTVQSTEYLQLEYKVHSYLYEVGVYCVLYYVLCQRVNADDLQCRCVVQGLLLLYILRLL